MEFEDNKSQGWNFRMVDTRLMLDPLILYFYSKKFINLNQSE